MEKLDLNKLEAKDGVLKIVHLTEEAEKIVYENAVVMKGAIRAPGNFIEKRKKQHVEKRSNVQYSYLNRYLELQTNENYKTLGYTVRGELKVNPQIEEFGINTTKTFRVQPLTKHIRMSSFLFPDKHEHAKLIEGLQNFSASVATDIKKINDQRGNIEDAFKTTLKSNAALGFTVRMPVFIGEEPKDFKVEIACHADNSEVIFWFESPALIELLANDTKAIIDAELLRFPETFVFIEQ